jgi:hypothetical protein
MLLLLGAAAPAAAQKLPDLHDQAAWCDKEKQEFLKFLRSNQQLPVTGDVKNVPAGKGGQAVSRRARYLALNLLSDKMNTGGPAYGGELIAGGHLFSWIRYYGGIGYTGIKRDKLDGTAAKLSHYQVPAGIEFALIPLGTPQTRYVLLRFGVSEHYFAGSAKSSDFRTSLKGWHPAWNAALGYEWQIPDTRWRVNIVAGAYKAFGGGNPYFYGTGLKTGLAYTF